MTGNHDSNQDKLGSRHYPDGGGGTTRFNVWAPFVEKIEVHIISPEDKLLPMSRDACGYHCAAAEGIEPGSCYYYRLDCGKEFPDPASRFQPGGVHGPSEVVPSVFDWQDVGWTGRDLKDFLIYELHVGTFTQEGTFDAVTGCLDYLKDLGVTAVELMPVAQFPGGRNWGYDGAYPFAVQDTYGGPGGLKRLVNACHCKGLAVVLDVVYNHLGPEGNHLAEFGPYFTDRYKTPWGAALNFDGAYSDNVRRFFIDNAVYWLEEFHIDALRLDALHAILDISSYPFLEELARTFHEAVQASGHRAYLIGESAANDARLIRPPEMGGIGLDAQWNDDFHHSLHALLTGEREGYYRDFGGIEHLVKAYKEGFVYSGQYSKYRKRRHGVPSVDIPAGRFAVFSQNHDQVGNRAKGDRLSGIVPFESLNLAAAVVLLSPYIPLLFMGEEYGETAPFPYFISHTDPGLVKAVCEGRRREFAAFQWQGELPDPQAEATFLSARIDRGLREEGWHRVLLELYRELIRLRKEVPALSVLSKDNMEIRGFDGSGLVLVRRWQQGSEGLAVFCFNDRDVSIELPVPAGRWRKQLDSGEARWMGKGSSLPEVLESQGKVTIKVGPRTFALFIKEA